MRGAGGFGNGRTKFAAGACSDRSSGTRSPATVAEGDALTAFDRIEESVRAAATALGEASTVIEQTTSSVRDMSASTQRANAVQVSIGTSSEALTATADELQRLVFQFRV